MNGSSYSQRSRRQQKKAARFNLLVVLFMLFTSIYATVGSIDPASAAQPDCPEGQELNDQDECVDIVLDDGSDAIDDGGDTTDDGSDATDDATDDTTDDVTDDGSEDAIDDSTDGTGYEEPDYFGRLDIYKYECESGYSGSDYLTDCQNLASGFSFSYSGSSGGSGSGTTDTNGYVGFTDLDPGAYTFSEDVPDGYRTPVVYCAFGDDMTSIGSFSEWNVGSSGSIELDFNDYAYADCRWFNVEDEDFGSVLIYKYYCDEYYEPSSYDYDWYFSECTESHDGATFYVGDQSMSIDGSDSVFFEDVPYGQTTLREEHEEGYGSPVVYCSQDSGTPGQRILYPVSDSGEWTVDYNEDGFQLVCYVYNQPDFHDITIYKYYCDEYYDAASYDYEWYSDECTTWQAGASFSYDGESKSITDDNNIVWWDTDDSSGYTLSETHETGYGTPVIYCWYTGSDDMYAEPTSYPVSDTGEWTAPYYDGYQLICYVFNQPEDNHDITIYKYYCDEYYEAASYDYDWYSEECTEWHDGASFEIDDETKTITSSDNVWFDDQPYGLVTITEQHEEGYGIPVVYCWQIGEEPSLAEPVAYPVSETGEWVAPYSDGYRLICYVFNQPEDNHDIYIYKYYCDEYYDAASYDYEWYSEECTTWQSGATFTYDGESKSITDENNEVWWDADSSSGYTLSETHESGYGTPVIYCWFEGADDTYAEPTSYPVSDRGEWSTPYYEGYRLYCYVYNQPETDHDIYVYKYYCDEYYDAASYGYEWYSEECTTWQDGASFSYGGESKSITDENNEVWWDTDETGGYTLSETHESGYGTPVVYCWYEGTDDTYAEPTSYPVSDSGEWSTPYYEGYRLYCYVYNIPNDNDITVFKYICPYGYYYEDASVDYLYEYCEVIEIPIPFSLYDGETLLETQETGSVLAGGVAYNGYDAAGGYRIQEEVPEGYEEPRVFCRVVTGSDEDIVFGSSDLTEYTVEDGWLELGSVEAAEATYDFGWYCEWFNFEAAADDNTVTIYKWECPIFTEDEQWEDTQEWLLEHCQMAMEDVDFNLDDLAGPRSLTTGADGKVEWTDVNNGPVTISETIPEGYGQPSVFCGWTAFYNGAVYDAFPQKVDAPDGVWSTSVDVPNSSVFCDWFNFPEQPGEITIYKYWCAEGYDLYEYGADPYMDCTDEAAGVEFSLDGDIRPTDQNGVVFWGDLAPGTYNIVETYPEGTDYSFILNCYGGRFAGIQPYPLQFENDLDVKVVSGDRISCYWFNVPEWEDGWITVYKYWCSTKTYASDVDCQIYEDGITFELYGYGSDTYIDEKTTSPVGKITWGGLEDGNYYLEEQDYDWCAIDISSKGPEESISVTSGQETVVKVYNCDPGKDVPESKRPQGKVPTKYPNTGVDPSTLTLPATGVGPIQGGDASTIAMLAIAATIMLAAGGFILRHRRTSIVAVDSSTSLSTVTSRRLVVGAAIGALGIPFVVAAQGDGNGTGDGDGNGNGQGDGSGNGQEGQGTPEGTPDVPQCRDDATPDAADPNEDPDCIRGEVPKHIAIESIGVDADIEIQEIIADEMQDPTGPELVTWYKETTRLGERGNGVYAGHLNYWGVAEAVFFGIKQLQPGAEIVLTGENDEEFVYTVDWVENQPGQDDPDPAVLGLTEDESITLITCGGEWDTTIAEYNERTAVRATRKQAEPDAS